jgi:hypothetical protein
MKSARSAICITAEATPIQLATAEKSGTGPGVDNWDMAFAKRFPVRSEGRYFQFRAEMFNTFNHTQYSSIDGGVTFNPVGQNTDPSSGLYTAARNPRIVELSLRFAF